MKIFTNHKSLLVSLVILMCAIPQLASSAIINPINGLNIGGTSYDVTFHDQPGDSFNALWDDDDDGTFGGGASIFSSQPTFWLDRAGAVQATDALISFLGLTGQTDAAGDSFLVPYGVFGNPTITGGPDNIFVALDPFDDLVSDISLDGFLIIDSNPLSTRVNDGPYASFARTVVDPPNTVPEPSTTLLLLGGLLSAAVARKRNRTV